jgi:hypothetical protein
VAGVTLAEPRETRALPSTQAESVGTIFTRPRHFALLVAGLLLCLVAPTDCLAEAPAAQRPRRILYNLDGDSCLTLKAGRPGPGPITVEDLRTLVAELTSADSQVDTLLVCINAQVMYYPTKVGTLRGTLSTPEERGQWSAHEQQRCKTIEGFTRAGVDPYAVVLEEARRRGLEALLTFRLNDAHGNDFLRTAFWRDHPECRLSGGALDFGQEAVREYVYRLIEEAVQRYDCDGIELDFLRFPTFFKGPVGQTQVTQINQLVERVRHLLEAEGARRGRRLVLAARPAADLDQSAPTYEKSVARGCDPAVWAREKWIDFLTVSEFLFTTASLDLPAWRQRVQGVPIYAAIQPEWKPSANERRCEFGLGADGYRRVAYERWTNSAEGIYLFNFFTAREWTEPTEPPFEVLSQIGDPTHLVHPLAPLVSSGLPKTKPDVVLYEGAYPGWPWIAKGTDGTLFCVFREGTEHDFSAAGRALLCRSRDRGRTWSKPTVLADAPGVDDRNVAITALGPGQLLAVFNTYTAARESLAVSVRSDDGGDAWTQPQPIGLPNTRTRSAPVLLADGTLLLPYYVAPGNGSLAARSVDNGHTWTTVRVPDTDGFLGDEWDALEVSPGRVIGLIRNSHPQTDGFFWKTESRDGGRTWSVPQKTNVQSQRAPSPPHLCRHNQTPTLIYADRRMVSVSAVKTSDVDFLTWDVPRRVPVYRYNPDASPIADGSYPASVQTGPQERLIVDYEIRPDSKRIAGYFVDFPSDW